MDKNGYNLRRIEPFATTGPLEDLSGHLGLKPLEVKRLRKALEASAPASEAAVAPKAAPAAEAPQDAAEVKRLQGELRLGSCQEGAL